MELSSSILSQSSLRGSRTRAHLRDFDCNFHSSTSGHRRRRRRRRLATTCSMRAARVIRM